jgi:Cdc6-like AAA superfamily ATPase
VYKHHVDRAQEEVERDRLLEQANGYSSGKKLVLFATAAVHAWSGDPIDSVPNPVMQQVYSFMCDITDFSEKSQPTLSRYVDEFEQGGLIETSHASKGTSTGVFRQIKMARSSELLVETLSENDSSIRSLLDDRELISSVVNTKLKEFYN